MFHLFLGFAEHWKLQKKFRLTTMNSEISWRRTPLVELRYPCFVMIQIKYLARFKRMAIFLCPQVYSVSLNMIPICHLHSVVLSQMKNCSKSNWMVLQKLSKLMQGLMLFQALKKKSTINANKWLLTRELMLRNKHKQQKEILKS